MAQLHAKFVEASITFLILAQLDLASGELMNKEHRTHGASNMKNDLSCYQCDTMEDGEKCSNLNSGNKTALLKKCHSEKRMCMVKRYSYTTSTENSTSVQRMWSLQRLCTLRCEPGCIVIGERTKLYACTACCSTNACNDGKGSAPTTKPRLCLLSTLILFLFLLPR